MEHFNKTMFCFERDGKKLGIRCELENFYDDWNGFYSYEVIYVLYTYYEYNGSGYYKEQKFDPSPDYVPIDNGGGIENFLSRAEYQRKIRKLYPSECEEAKKLFIKEYFNI